MSEQKIKIVHEILKKVEELGEAAAAKHFGKSATTIQKWMAGTSIPDIGAAQIIVDEILNRQPELYPGDKFAFSEPPPQNVNTTQETPVEAPKATTLGDTQQTLAMPEAIKMPPRKHAFLVPINRLMTHTVTLGILGNWKSTLPPEIQEMLARLHFEADTTPAFARNILAKRFLEGGDEWSFWIDSDVIAPIGNPGWIKNRVPGFRKYSDEMFRRSAVDRLTTRGKTIVSGVYTARNDKQTIVSSIGLGNNRPQNEQALHDTIKNEGPKDAVHQVTWAGFGCIAVHRNVFLDILKTQPEIAAKNDKEAPNFFTAFSDGPTNEDVAFCARAARAGHPTFLDQGTFCGHVGHTAYSL